MSNTDTLHIEFGSDLWFSPHSVLFHYVNLLQLIGEVEMKKGKYKTVREAFAAALMLFGIMQVHQQEYFLQMVDPDEQTPDIRTMFLGDNEDGIPWMFYQDVEVVTYTPHSNESLADFILRTKLNPKKAYPPETIILCHLEKTGQTEPWDSIHQALKASGTKNRLFLLARVDPVNQIYQLACIHPEIDFLTTTNIVDEFSKRPTDLANVRRMVRGTKKLLPQDESKVVPFYLG